jgi:hypothetical protein
MVPKGLGHRHRRPPKLSQFDEACLVTISKAIRVAIGALDADEIEDVLTLV